MAQDCNYIFSSPRIIHCIGIGGSGMFPLVQLLHDKGHKISGSDNNESDTLNSVRKMGIKVYLGQRAENISPDTEVVIYSAAIMADNPELIAAKSNPNLICLERADVLGYFTSLFKQSVCISGTHGKTTTTALLTQILFENDLDPSAIIGGKLPSIGGSGRSGKSDVLVCESCEYVDTFLRLSPDIAVVLNIDQDHMEYFKTPDNLKNSFRMFAEKATDFILFNGDDKNCIDALKCISKPVITFGLNSSNDYYAENIRIEKLSDHKRATSFTIKKNGNYLTDISLNIPGIHNVYNALAACAVCDKLGLTTDQIQKGVRSFNGAGRRFETLGVYNGATIADDYAHHPAELKATIDAARSLEYDRVIAVFQPFTFSRTFMLMDDFAHVLNTADKVILTPIMGSREKNTWGVDSSQLADKLNNCTLVSSFEEAVEEIKLQARAGDLIITLGCGDIYKVAKKVLSI